MNCICVGIILSCFAYSHGDSVINLNGFTYAGAPPGRFHQFMWKEEGSIPVDAKFESILKTQSTSNQSFYVVTGDFQFWFHCVPNSPCQIQSKCDWQTDSDCSERQNDWANKVHQYSITALSSFIDHKLNRTKALKGMIINGDLTDFGHGDEFDKFIDQIILYAPLKIYPGLGNHDYQNNVNDCFMNRCAKRMISWFKNNVPHMTGSEVDMSHEGTLFYDTYEGSLAYSWNHCLTKDQPSDQCFHFVQLNNYPTYRRTIFRPLSRYVITDSINWLKTDLHNSRGQPIFINFHRFDQLSSADISMLKELFSEYEANVQGIFFAHMHSLVGLAGHWCINGKLVPLIYSGSVPGNNYLLLSLNHNSNEMEHIYRLQVQSETKTNVNQMDFRFNGLNTC